MSEEMVIRYCSPTLAGLKTGSIFNCNFNTRTDLNKYITTLNKKLVKKGLRVIPLRINNEKRSAMIYVYRPKKLSADLSNEEALRILSERNYMQNSSFGCVLELMKRLKTNEDFPHEIGLFLGYPPEDVCGFIENGAANCKCVGTWKVYGNEAQARETFEKYKKCTRVYCNHFAKGSSIEHLTVADLKWA